MTPQRRLADAISRFGANVLRKDRSSDGLHGGRSTALPPPSRDLT